MASIFASLSPTPPLFRSKSNAICQHGIRSIQSSNPTQMDSNSRVYYEDERCGSKRRDVLHQILLSAFSLPILASQPAFAEIDMQDNFRIYEDDVNKFRILVPQASQPALAEIDMQDNFRIYEDEVNKFRILVAQGWFVGTADTTSFKSVTAFYPEEVSDSNVSIAITGVGPDFTSLKSFGTVDAFAETLVNGLDRSWKRPPGLAAKLIDCKSANGLYYVEYTLQNPGERCRHLYSTTGMASNGWYNRLYTVTGQFMEDESTKYQSLIEKAVSSFRLK